MAPAPQISVIIATKDYARFVGNAISSVIDQTLSPSEYEVVVVDDGSIDETKEVVASFGNKVRYFYQANNGQGSALNSGIERARGRFVSLLDADDYFYPDKLSEVLRCFLKDPAIGMVHHRLDVVDGEGRWLKESPFRTRLDEGSLREQIISRGGTWYAIHTVATSALSFRREILEAVLPIPETEFRTMADGYLVTQVPLMTNVGAIHTPLACYRIHGGNNWATERMSANDLKRKLIEPLETVSRFVNQRLKEEGCPDRVDVKIDPYYLEHVVCHSKLQDKTRQWAILFLGWRISEMIRLFQKKAKVIFIKIEAAEKHLSGQFFSSI